MKGYNTQVQSLEQEKAILKERVTKLELTVAESQANANVVSNIDITGDSVLAQMKVQSLKV